MEGTGIGKDVTEIVGLLIGVALIALIIGNAGGASTVIGTSARAFNQLLQTVTLQSGFGGNLSGGVGPISGSMNFGGQIL